ncbi:probable deca-heme c-type cytochrome [Vibrio maritimus]|uniref:Probable deca-heme c-type cytochrome n=1 Tax=Vibrio maritimus TaxID=990268 RepID=A0A090TQS8_9VIBR|nr:probable deca-heme c-type cytochrome [Vibrio maritimus]
MKVYFHAKWLIALIMLVAPWWVTAEQSEPERHWSGLAQNTSNELSVRLAAMQQLIPYSGANTLITVARASRDPAPEMRIAAIKVASYWNDIARWDVVSPLLNDKDVDVQGAAIRSLLPLAPKLNSDQKKYLDDQMESFLKQRASSMSIEIAELHIARGDFQQAKNVLTQLTSQGYSQEHISLLTSEIFWREGNKQKALNYLDAQASKLTDVSPLYYQMGLMLVTEKRFVDAEAALHKAHMLEPDEPKYLIALATLTKEDSPKKAVSMFEQLYQMTQLPEHLYNACYLRLKSGLSVDSCMNELAIVAPHIVLNEF